MGKRELRLQLWEALLKGLRLDGAAGVLDGQKGGLVLREQTAPIVLAAFQIEEDRSPCAERSGAKPDIERFEMLSLAARLKVAMDVSKSGCPQAKRLAERLKFDLDAFPEIPGDLIAEVLAQAAAKLDKAGVTPSCDALDKATSADLQVMRGGLFISGARITGNLSLYNANFPFPVRFQGCIFEKALTADHCKLRSLDLSGSVTPGMSATFLEADGNVRLRRTMSYGPIDMGGARVRGVLDVSDIIVLPFVEPPKRSAFSGDRGIFNLSLATVENELRGNRARIYGGLTMKGATIKRSMFLEQADIVSPIGTLVKMALLWLEEGCGPEGQGAAFPIDQYPELKAHLDKERQKGSVGRLLHDNEDLCAAELLGLPALAHDAHNQILLFRLLAESIRARTTAVRADGLTVEGSIFGRGLTSRGRFRLRYATITGSLNLDGAQLSASRDSDNAIKVMGVPEDRLREFRRVAQASWTQAKSHELAENDDYAVDIRDSRFSGAVVLRGWKDPSGVRPTRVEGAVCADQVHIGAGFDLTDVAFVRLDGRGKGLSVRHGVIGCDITLAGVRNLRGFDAGYAKIAGSLYFIKPKPFGLDWEEEISQETDASHEDAAPAPLSPQLRESSQRLGEATINSTENCADITGFIDLRSLVTGGDVYVLFHRQIVQAIRLKYARIGGSLNIFPGIVADEGAPSEVLETRRKMRTQVTCTLAQYDDIIALHQKAEQRDRDQRKIARDQKKPGPLVVSRPKAYLDLRETHVRVLRHPPNAWPAPNGLLITGLTYEASGSAGPLGAIRNALVEEAWPSNLSPNEDRRNYGRGRWTIVSGLALLIVVGVFELLALSGVVSFDAVRTWTPVGAFLWSMGGWISNWLGMFNLALFVSLAIVVYGFRILGLKTAPTRSDSKPMANHWLKLQERSVNPARRLQTAIPTEPYLMAAKALKLMGEHKASELVELDRMRNRYKDMSMRHQLLARTALRTLDLVAQYGFSVSRAVVVTGFFLIASAGLAQWAFSAGLIRQVEVKAADSVQKAAPPCGQPLAPRSSNTNFLSLPYAADKLLPIKLGEGARWEEVKAPNIACDPVGPVHAKWLAVLEVLLLATRLLGVSLIAILGAAAVARAESFLSRLKQ